METTNNLLTITITSTKRKGAHTVLQIKGNKQQLLKRIHDLIFSQKQTFDFNKCDCDLSDNNPVNDYILLFFNNRLVNIAVADIIYLRASGSYCEVKIKDEKNPHTVCVPLGNICNQLPEKHFVRIHNSYVVNMRFLNYIEGKMFCLRNGEVLPIGRQYFKELKMLLRIVGTKSEKYLSHDE